MTDVLEFDHNVFSAQQAESDKTLAVRFFKQPLKDEVASTEHARPIYNDTEMVEIRVRGDRNNIIIRAVRSDDIRRFRGAYMEFKDGAKAAASGTPLAEWPIMSSSMVEELKYLGFHTVEQLAEANDAAMSKVPGLSTMKNRAKAFLEFAKGISPLEKIQADMAAMQNANEVRDRQLAESQAAYTELDKKYRELLETKVLKKAA
jgi:hypothetical protein